MGDKQAFVGIAYREQPGIRILAKDGDGLSVESFRDWLWDQQCRWVRVTLETFDKEPDPEEERKRDADMRGGW